MRNIFLGLVLVTTTLFSTVEVEETSKFTIYLPERIQTQVNVLCVNGKEFVLVISNMGVTLQQTTGINGSFVSCGG